MPTLVTYQITGISTLSQSKPHSAEQLPGESHDDYKQRTWREHLHCNAEGMIFIPPNAMKNGLSESAKFMNISIPGKGKNTYTKHVEAGVACIKPIMLGLHKDKIDYEKLFLPADGRRGSGKRVWKWFPYIPVWGGDVELVILDETVLQTSHRSGEPILLDLLEGMGQYIGLGRFRPRNNGYYGRFTVSDFKVQTLSLAA